MQKSILGTVLALASTVLCQQTITPGPHNNTYNGLSRGFSFTSAQAFNITQLDLPLDAQQAGDTAAYLIIISGTQVHHSFGNAGAVTVALPVAVGDTVRVVGNWSPAVPGNATAHNSYATGGGSTAVLIGCDPHTLFRAGQQWDVGDPLFSGTGFEGVTGSMGRVIVTTSLAGTGCAANENFGTGCIQTFNSFYELFAPGNTQDLNGTAFSIQQTATGSLTIPSTTAARGTATATNLNIGDDQEISVAFSVGTLSMPTPNGPVTGLTIQSNGMVSTAPNTIFWTPNVANFLGYPNTIWSPCWTDLLPQNSTVGSGGVYVEETNTHFYVIYDAVESWGAPGPGNTAELHFEKATGTCEMIIVSLDGLGGDYLVGHTVGGASGDPGGSDLSALTVITTSNPELASLHLEGDTRPILGTVVNMTLTNIPAGSPISFLLYGLAAINPGIDLTGIGMPGCFQYANQHAVVLFPAAVGSAMDGFNVPTDPSFTGLIIGAQGASYVPGVNAGNAVSSNGVILTIGN